MIENKINDLNDLEKNNQKEKDEEFSIKINNLEQLINEIDENRKKSEIQLEQNIELINNNDIINKVNNIIDLTKEYENQFKNIENEINDNNNYIEDLNKKINNLEIKQKEIIKEKENKENINQNELFRKVTTNSIFIENIIPNNDKKIKKQRQNNHKTNKNYKIEKEENQPIKKYNSQTFSKGNTSSHSVSKVKKNNNLLDKNVTKYQTLTRPRSTSKEHEDKDNNKEYETSINESKIVEYDDIVFVENKIKETFPKLKIELNLVYRASEDGDKSSDFHNKCDKIGPNVTIVKTKKGYIFGGFTVKNWEHLKRDIDINKPNLGSASRDSRAFGFCVNLQKIYNNERPDELAIWCNRNFGPTFKNNFFQIFDNCFKKGGYCSIKNNSHFGGQEYNYEINGGEPKFAVEDIEVYEVLFQ